MKTVKCGKKLPGRLGRSWCYRLSAILIVLHPQLSIVRNHSREPEVVRDVNALNVESDLWFVTEVRQIIIAASS